MKAKVGFIADFFDILGGAEKNDNVLIEYLSNKFEVIKIQSHLCTISKLNQCDILIVSNFVNLSEKMKSYISENKKYLIYEHDHKYVKSRDPSKYPNFKIPPHQLANVTFYKHASSVVVLSKICKEVLLDNIPLKNVHNIGTSLWSDQKLNKIELLLGSKKEINCGVLNSNNPIKGKNVALAWCREHNIVPELISSDSEEEFLQILSKCQKLVFTPQVLETFSRLTAEAKMLDCTIVTNRALLGFASEASFELSGRKLIEETKKRVKKALETFETEINNIMTGYEKDNNSITSILTCYRRPELLQEQIESIRGQTCKPDQIWLWVNNHKDNQEFDFSKVKVDRIIKSNFNWKFHGRFALAQMANTKYVALFDDDTIPGIAWFENCLSNIKEKPGIYGGVGVILNEKKYSGHTRIGWSNPNSKTTEVDLVGHAWFFEKKSLQYMWREEPYTWENGEDIQFSYLCKKYGNIKTYVPEHPLENRNKFSSLKGIEYGVDDKATSHPSNHEIFYSERDQQVKSYISSGWKTVKELE